MKRFFGYFMLLVTVITLYNCQDNRMDGMIDDRVCLLNPGLITFPVINFGTYNCEMVISKGGMGTQDAVVSLRVNPQYLEDHNATTGDSLELLPADCYQLPGSVTIKASDLTATETIVFNTEKIFQLQKDRKFYVLPVEIVSENGIAIYEKKNYAMITLLVEQPVIGFYKPGMIDAGRITPEDPNIIIKETEIDLNYTVDYDVAFQLKVVPDSVTDYNVKHGTNYKVLPTDAYELNSAEWVVKAGKSTAKITYKIFRDKLFESDGVTPLFGNLVLPLYIDQVSAYGVSPIASTQMLRVNYDVKKFNKQSWTILGYNSCINMDPGKGTSPETPDKILDGDTLTYWMSRNDTLFMQPLAQEPYYISFDMKAVKSVYQIQIRQRTGNNLNRNIKTGYLQYSDDGNSWIKLEGSDFTLTDRTATGVISLIKSITPTKTRYLKLVITGGYTEAATVVQGKYKIAIVELDVLGFE